MTYPKVVTKTTSIRVAKMGQGSQRRRRAKAVNEARQERVGVIAALVGDLWRRRDLEGRVGRAEEAVVEVKRQRRVDVVAHAGDCLIAELPVVAVEQLADPGDPGVVDDVEIASECFMPLGYGGGITTLPVP